MAPEPPRLPRAGREREPMRVPMLVADSGLVVIDATWGTITPIKLAEGIVTVGELEVMEHLGLGLPLVDTRPSAVYTAGTIPGARNIPHAETMERIDELDSGRLMIFFCNGPQCGATPDAIETLVASGYPPTAIGYYRGGMHDWISLGLPTEVPPPPT